MQLLMNQDGIAGVRYCFGTDGNGVENIVLTAVDSEGNDIEKGVLLDYSDPCPSACSVPNSLNNY